MSIDWPPLLFALMMAAFDVIFLGIVKAHSIGTLRSWKWMILPTLAYALQPWFFLKSLSFSSLIVMNLLWDLTSGVLVTAEGLFFFGEKLSKTKIAGVLLSFVSVYLLTCKDAELC